VCVLGAVVGQVSAVDLDSPPYDSFSYRLRDDDPDSIYFRVDDATGNIRTAVTLDRERRRMYRMSVIAQSDTVRVFLILQPSLSDIWRPDTSYPNLFVPRRSYPWYL